MKTPSKINDALDDLLWEFRGKLGHKTRHCLGTSKVVQKATLTNRKAIAVFEVTDEYVDWDADEGKMQKPFEVMRDNLRFIPYITDAFKVEIRNEFYNFVDETFEYRLDDKNQVLVVTVTVS
jgi:hypothetical protein